MSPPAARPPATAGEYFGAMAESYDSLIRRAVPCYDEMTARLLHYLPGGAGAVMELGCGTGNLSLALATRYPEARFTIVDSSQEMLDLTRSRLEKVAPRAATNSRFIACRFEQLAVERGEFDLVTSAISLHHVADKQPLFHSVRAALREGGRLCFSDQMSAEPEAASHDNWQEWLAFCRAPGNCSEEEVASLVAHAEAHDHYESAAAHLHMLLAAGFREVDCLWRSGMWAIVTATA